MFESTSSSRAVAWGGEDGPPSSLLGRKTFDIFASYWPQHADNWPGINEVTKYVVSNTAGEADWSNTTFLGGLDDIRTLKESGDADLTVWGCGDLIETLLEDDLVDELVVVTYPVTLGSGKKLFDPRDDPRGLHGERWRSDAEGGRLRSVRASGRDCDGDGRGVVDRPHSAQHDCRFPGAGPPVESARQPL